MKRNKKTEKSNPNSDTVQLLQSFDLVKISAGKFSMGNDALGVDTIQHTVTISSDYWIGKHEVTQEEWERVMGNNPSSCKGEKLPVENVSWLAANDFCNKLNEQTEGKRPDGYYFSLPTEAQWEYAAKGCDKSSDFEYSGSNNCDEIAWYDENSDDRIHEVCTKKPNELGIYDMTGNVSEWCLDWYERYQQGEVTDPKGAETGSYRVFRGGNQNSNTKACNVAKRFHHYKPNYAFGWIGFRLALVTDKQNVKTSVELPATQTQKPEENADKNEQENAKQETVKQAQEPEPKNAEQENAEQETVKQAQEPEPKNAEQETVKQAQEPEPKNAEQETVKQEPEPKNAEQKTVKQENAEPEPAKQEPAKQEQKPAKQENAVSKSSAKKQKEIKYGTAEELLDSLDLVKIQSGVFEMGAKDGRKGDKQHDVVLSKDYWIGRFEVTQFEWMAVMGSNPSFFKGENLPVENISWNDAMAFCDKLNAMTDGKRPDGYKFSLPTEAQWEYMARGGCDCRGFEYGGSDICGNVAWFYENSGRELLNNATWDAGKLNANDNKTHEVGTKPSNELGIYDVSGNVSEWCLDIYGRYPEGRVTDPVKLNSGSGRVVRGGSWINKADFCATTKRSFYQPKDYGKSVGFRLALVPDN